MAKNNRYNLDKDGYDLSKDTDEVPVVVNNGNGDKKSHSWLWILLAILVIVGVVLAIVLAKGKDKSNAVEEVTPIEQVEEQSSEQPEVTTTEEIATPSEAVSEPVEENVTAASANETAPVATPKPAPESHTKATNAANDELTGDIEKDARMVIQGKFQNYPQRKQLIEAAGGNYEQIQSRVNELMRQ